MSIEDFGKSNFADKRINKRYYEIMEELSKDPGSSFPQIMKDWSDLKGFYRFISNSKVTAKEILSPHISSTVERCFEEEVVLAVQDTTYLNYSTHKKAKGLGKISDKENLRGMIVHSVIGVGGKESKYLGVLSEEIIIRNGEKNKGNETKKERLGRKRESGKWIKGLEVSNELLKGHKKVIQVCDREADIYLFVKRIIELAQCFVIRCAYKNRTTESGNIMDEIKRAKKVGRTEIKIEKNGTRKERVARVEIKRCRCMIKAPTIMNRKGKPLPLNIVIVEEISKIVGQEKLEWILLTSEPIETFEDCMKVVGYYKSRWQIEEFHKTLKSGCKIEERQIESKEGLIKVLSLFSIVAYQILKMRYLAKCKEEEVKIKDIPISPIQIVILINFFPKENHNLTPQKILFLIARLGGFIGRKSDKTPGLITLLRGFHDLNIMERGYLSYLRKDVGK